MGLSAVIITLNEERNISRCIDSLVEITDEIIVIDSYSQDQTKSICENKGVRFIQKEWNGYAATKNDANSLATHDYILSIDADEEISDTLKKSIIVEKSKGFQGVYSFNRKTNYCGKWIRFLGWYPDKKIRIFPKDNTKWQGNFVHEELKFDLPLTEHFLQGDLNHYSYYNHKEHRERADKYSILTAQKLFSDGKRVGALRPFVSAIGRFVSMFFLKLGFLEGSSGWMISKISAASNYVKYKELIRLQNIERNRK